MSEPMMWLLVRGVWETLAMTFVSGFFWLCDWVCRLAFCFMSRVRGKLLLTRKLYRTNFCDCEHFPFHPVHYLAGYG
ncbi:D-methionine ABC transporter permease [Escherichia coli]|uniref:D-methionine ABC transporter permease n=1 Tax=Escherichia coli TaxID=562 RepID=A0A377KCL9_ECOLX|nr:D-methionine ABC transporter permease [Escherichia coli]